MPRIRLICATGIDGKHVEAGEFVDVSVNDAMYLTGIGKAVLEDGSAPGPTSEPFLSTPGEVRNSDPIPENRDPKKARK